MRKDQADAIESAFKDGLIFGSDYTPRDATVEQVMADGDRDRWFSADEALEYGFIDHIQKHAEGATGVGTK